MKAYRSLLKLDLHSHSTLSYDGGISLSGYKRVLHEKIVHCIAITDHNEIDFALAARQELGEGIIVGEEIKAVEGEVIGLFLSTKIAPGLSVVETIREIKKQHGIVYVPHPFDMVRHGLSEEVLRPLLGEIDLIEIFNARSISKRDNILRYQFAKDHSLTGGVGSDAHSFSELGKTYTMVTEIPNASTIRELLSNGQHHTVTVSPLHRLNPFINKVTKRWTS
jgi:predicted metal-dependent phosphoesterase TrpH